MDGGEKGERDREGDEMEKGECSGMMSRCKFMFLKMKWVVCKGVSVE